MDTDGCLIAPKFGRASEKKKKNTTHPQPSPGLTHCWNLCVNKPAAKCHAQGADY